LSLASSRTGRNRRAGSKAFVYIRVANFADFQTKIANLGFLLKRALGIFLPISICLNHYSDFSVIWVGNTVFAVPVLYNEKHRQMTEAAKHYF
jgi:hypothetical protein